MKESQIPIFLSSNDNYASLVAVTIASICYSTGAHIHFYVLDGGISEFHKKQITSLQKKFSNFDITFTRIDTEKEFKNFTVDNYLSKDTYSRFLIPDLFPEINKALYLDVDIVVLDDIMELFTQDLHGYPLGAVPHKHVENGLKGIERLNLSPSHHDVNAYFLLKSIERLNLSPSHHYFNAGVLLIDCEQWRKKDCTNLLITLAAEGSSQFVFHDQCVLNKFFENNYQVFDYRFNAMSLDFEWLKENNIQQYNELLKSTVIRHYESQYKPFSTNILFGREKFPHFEDFWFFAEMTPFYAGLKQKFLCSMLNSTQNEMTNKIAKEVTKESVKEIINIKEVMKEMIRIITKKIVK